MKKHFALAAALLVAAGCSSFRTNVYEDNLSLPLSEGQTDSLFYSLSLEYVTGGLPKEACQQINNTLVTTAFDLEDGRNKIFKVSRMEEVEVLEDRPWTREAEHELRSTDVFRMAGREAFRVRLRLTMKAKNLLVEEYPLAERDLTADGDAHWILDTGICAVAGVGRFVSGLAGEVEILDGEPLKDYLRDYSACFSKLFSL